MTFAKTSALLGVELLDLESDSDLQLLAIDVLRYPPEERLPYVVINSSDFQGEIAAGAGLVS